MHQSIHISRAWLTKQWIRTWLTLGFVVLLAQGCASRAPSLRVLDTRAGYGSEMDDEEVALYQRGQRSQDSIVKQGGHRVVTAYIYPHELPTRDYFWGAYVSLVVGEDSVVFENPADEDPVAAIKETKKGKQAKKKSVLK